MKSLSAISLVCDSEILQLVEELPPELFAQEIGADFTEFAGQVFKDFDEAYHVGDLRFNPELGDIRAATTGSQTQMSGFSFKLDLGKRSMFLLKFTRVVSQPTSSLKKSNDAA